MARVNTGEIPDAVYRSIEQRAKAEGVTIEQEVTKILERAIAQDVSAKRSPPRACI